jgi:hypothetical protein|tara:strand:+ start:12 stop:539 length:528 start_codon:yes stop_codon:yes gene_type:complete
MSSEIILRGSVILDHPYCLLSDKKINLKKGDLKKVMLGSKSIKNTKVFTIRSFADGEFGFTEYKIYSKKIKNKKPSEFYFLTKTALASYDVEKLLKKTKEYLENTGKIKIETGKIFSEPFSRTKNSHIENFNKSFSSEAENGVYEVFQFDFICNEADSAGVKGDDRLCIVKKNRD